MAFRIRLWVIDLDIRAFFDTVPWDLVVKAVTANTDLPWVVLYVKRWLEAPLALPDGTLRRRDRGTPQGSAISPAGVPPCVREEPVSAAVMPDPGQTRAREYPAHGAPDRLREQPRDHHRERLKGRRGETRPEDSQDTRERAR